MRIVSIDYRIEAAPYLRQLLLPTQIEILLTVCPYVLLLIRICQFHLLPSNHQLNLLHTSIYQLLYHKSEFKAEGIVVTDVE